MNLTQLTSDQLLKAYRLKVKIETRQNRLEKLFHSILGTVPKPAKKRDPYARFKTPAWRRMVSERMKQSWARRKTKAA